jgi:hypothetical protein
MATLVITPDDSCLDVPHETALIYDLESGDQIGLIPYTSELEVNVDKCIGRPVFRPFGIECDGNSLLIASNDKIGKFLNGKFLGLVDVPAFVNTHQIRKHDGTLYVCNSANDTIGAHSEAGSFYINVADGRVLESALPTNDAEASDHCHVNTLEFHDGILYYCLHYLGQQPSQFWKFDPKTKTSQHLFSVGYCCHGIKIVDGTLWTLSTGTGELVGVNQSKNKYVYYKIADPDSEFLRGLDFFGGKLYYGISANTVNNSLEYGSVIEFDLKEEAFAKKIDFPYKRIADLLVT